MLKYEIINNQKREWVVFIHGLGGSAKTWKKQVDSFSENYNLLLLDLPGHGQNADKSIDKVDPQKVNNGIKATLDYLGIERAHFVGLSIGTVVIADFAVCYPNYIDTIILGGCALQVGGFYKRALMLINGMRRFVPYDILYKFLAWYMMPRKRHKKSRLFFLREVGKLRRETLFAWMDHFIVSLNSDEDLDKLERFCKRILLISGAEDHFFIKDAKDLAAKMSNVEIRVIPECGHICSIENAAAFNHIALEYLSFCECETK